MSTVLTPVRRPSSGRVRRVLHELPAEARTLAAPWHSLVPEIPGLTPELEREFRAGQRIVCFDGKYRLGGAIKGGSSAMWIPASDADVATFEGWAAREAVPRVRSLWAYFRLKRFCARRGIRLVNGAPGAKRVFSPRLGWIYAITRRVLAALPATHVRPPGLRTLQVGGWGPDGAKASAYEDGVVMLYDFAIKGAQRTFLGLLLHEVGHVLESQLGVDDRAAVRRLHHAIVQGRALVGVEFLYGASARLAYQANACEEFLAETYMIYTSQGDRLRAHIAACQGDARGAWEQLYARFVDWFGGMEYK